MCGRVKGVRFEFAFNNATDPVGFNISCSVHSEGCKEISSTISDTSCTGPRSSRGLPAPFLFQHCTVRSVKRVASRLGSRGEAAGRARLATAVSLETHSDGCIIIAIYNLLVANNKIERA